MYIAIFFELGRLEAFSALSLTRTFWHLTRGSGGGAPSGVRGRAPRRKNAIFYLNLKDFIAVFNSRLTKSEATQRCKYAFPLKPALITRYFTIFMI